jgi:hypothetical protein
LPWNRVSASAEVAKFSDFITISWKDTLALSTQGLTLRTISKKTVNKCGHDAWKAPSSDRLNDVELELQFLAPNHVAQIELPELAGEAKRRPTLIEIDDPFQTNSTPEIRQRNVSADGFQFHLSIEGKQLTIINEAVE